MKAKKIVLPLFVPLVLTDTLPCADKNRCKSPSFQLYPSSQNDECRTPRPIKIKYMSDTEQKETKDLSGLCRAKCGGYVTYPECEVPQHF